MVKPLTSRSVRSVELEANTTEREYNGEREIHGVSEGRCAVQEPEKPKADVANDETKVRSDQVT